MATTFGGQLANWEQTTSHLDKKIKKSGDIEKKLDKDMESLIEYTKWISGESQKLRDRVRASEKVINDLKSSGESSVESLMETLYILKIRQEEMDSEA